MRQLGKRYGEQIVTIDRLRLRVRRGGVYGVPQADGAGKTPTLVGLIRPTAGSALVFGPFSRHACAPSGTRADVSRRRVAFLQVLMWSAVELREIRVFLTLAEELHFGRTALFSPAPARSVFAFQRAKEEGR